MIDWSSCAAVERDPERYSGAWLFRATRVPIAALFENLEDDARVEDFLHVLHAGYLAHRAQRRAKIHRHIFRREAGLHRGMRQLA